MAEGRVRAGMDKRFGLAALTLALRAGPLPEGEGLIRLRLCRAKVQINYPIPLST